MNVFPKFRTSLSGFSLFTDRSVNRGQFRPVGEQNCSQKMKFLLTEFAFLIALTTCLCGAEFKVLLNPENTNVSDALVVVFPKVVTVSKGQKTLKYKILNRSSEHIFVVIDTRNVEGWTELKGTSGSMGGGGIGYGSENTHESLRLLYAPRRDNDGSLYSGEDEMSSETFAKVNIDSGYQKDLSHWIGAKGTLRLQMKFYVGTAKDRRIENVFVPIEIQNGEVVPPNGP